ncbi:radical SAM protein [Clostridium sp.]|jgi:hypothetical protein|uniref:radical SAM protein n=1 Tax=Clostridium sp. TaxID=1506 RepID=UPI0035213BEA
MPNIMLTYGCNLKCPYCFANEFVNKKSNYISKENFIKAINFLTHDDVARVGLIGGEPTLHPYFKDFLEYLIENRRVSETTIYTNGILLNNYINQVITPKFRLLVNCNSPKEIGEDAFEKLRSNLDVLINKHYMRERINLGINLYSDDLDYSYIIDLLKMCGLHRVRISLTVPDFSICGSINAIEYFKRRKNFLLGFLHKMQENNILPYYDCNKPPYCIWSDEEKEWIENMVEQYHVESNLVGDHSFCYPVIDILPDLQAVRCFGMSEYEKVKIDDFQNVSEIASYFLNHIDSASYQISAVDECKECKKRQLRKCTAGCIGFKSGLITKLNDYAKSL